MTRSWTTTAWGHLQLDATALFLLQLAQLTRSALVIVQSEHERDFIQNLVYCVARAYRVADYGIWERGDKGNHGLPERNASSIGLGESGLGGQSLVWILFGPHGDGSCRHHFGCRHDAVRAPQDRALDQLCCRGNRPARRSIAVAFGGDWLSLAWGVEDPMSCAARTQATPSTGSSAGRYGYSRFRRDGHQTVVEDSDTPALRARGAGLALKASNANGPCFWPLSWSAACMRGALAARPR